MSQAPNTRPNPYVGPRPFERGETLLGREREINDLLHLLMAERIVLFYSPSGAGKTSLIQAGLIPRLEQEEFRVLPVMRVSHQPADLNMNGNGNRYVLSVLLALEQNVPAAQRRSEAQLAQLSFGAYLDQREADRAEESEALIFDQFEEMLTVDPTDRAGKEAFFTQVGAALRKRNRWALFSMREEYRAGLDPYLRPVPTRFSTTYRLDLLEERAARLAIQQPARSKGVTFDDDAAQQLVDELRKLHIQRSDVSLAPVLGLYIEPMQLQVVCRRLWERLPGDVTQITTHDITQAGAVDTALADFYADSVKQIAAQATVGERLIREWFDEQLINPQGIRVQVMREPERSGNLDNRVIELLENAHLVRAEARRGETWYELAHDRLVAPIRQNNAAWFTANLSTLQRQAKLWDENHRQAGFLLSGEALTDVEQSARAQPEALNAREQDFLKESRAARAGAERERKQNERILRRGIIATIVSVAALLALIAAIVFAIQAKDQAQNASNANATSAAQAVNALNAQSTADAEAINAVNAKATAVAEASLSAKAAQDAAQARATAVSARDAAISRYAASLAANALSSIGADPERAILLAMQSISVTFTVQGEEALHQAIENSHVRLRLTDTRNGVMRDAAFSPDGQRIVTVGETRLGMVWNATSGERLFDLAGHGSQLVLSAAFNPSGTLITTAGGDHNVILWNAATGERRNFLPDHAERTIVNQAEFSSDGRWIVSAGTDQTARIWDVNACPEHDFCHSVITFTAHMTFVNSAGFDPTGQWVVSGSQDGTIRVWNRMSGEERLKIQSNEIVHSVAFSPRGDKIASAHEDGAVRIWDAQTGHLDLVLRGHSSAVLSARYDPSGNRIVTAGNDSLVNIWETENGFKLLTLNGHGAGVHSARFSPDGQMVVTAGIDKTVRVWDLSVVEQTLMHGHTKPVLRAVFSADGTRVATASEDRTARVWDTLSGKELVRFDQHQDSVLDVAFSPDGRYLTTASADHDARIWDITTRQLVHTLQGHRGAVTGVAYSPDGSLIATASEDKSIRLWNAVSGTPSLTITTGYPLNNVAFSPDGTMLLSGDSNVDPPGARPVLVQLWDARTGQVLQTFSGHTRPIFAANFSSDGQMIVTAGGDSSVRVWDTASGKEITLLAGHTGRITSTAFSPDGQRIMSVARDHTVRFWDIKLGRDVMQLRGNTDLAVSAIFSRDGKYFLIAGSDGDVRIYLARIEDLMQLARTRVTRDLTCSEKQRFLYQNIACNQ